MKNLNQFRFNYTSQAGEDGLIQYLCNKINIEKGWCVEFGAWDGKHLSNTYTLINKKNWSAVLIESLEERFIVLKEKYKDRKDIYIIKAHVGFKAEDPFRLDALLKQTPVPINFELLSIDVDGNDWFIWESLKEYNPKIVIIEANSTFNYDVYKVGEPGSGIGASARAITELGKEKGYELVAHTGNCIFIRKEYFHLIDLEDNSLNLLFEDKFYHKEQKRKSVKDKTKFISKEWFQINFSLLYKHEYRKKIYGKEKIMKQSKSLMMELWEFIRLRKKYWLLPIILCLILLGGLIIFTETSIVSTFIYTLF